MVSQRFDPFNSRKSRDIRNTLSHALVQSLEQMNPTIFRYSATNWLARDLAPFHYDYVKDRLKRYERVYAELQKSAFDDTLSQTLLIWNEQLFFEVHERLEPIWQQASGDERKACKGLIKAAAAYVHLEHGNKKAAKSLAAKAADLLSKHGKSLSACLNLGELLTRLRETDPVAPRLEIQDSCNKTL